MSEYHDDSWLMRNGRYDDLLRRQRRRDWILGILFVGAVVALWLAAGLGWIGDGPLPLDYPEADYRERWIR